MERGHGGEAARAAGPLTPIIDGFWSLHEIPLGPLSARHGQCLLVLLCTGICLVGGQALPSLLPLPGA